MTTLNSARFVEDTVKSVLNQTYQKWEMIVVDCGSTDNTVEIVKSFKDRRIRIIVRSDLRRSAQLNLALQESQAKYVAIIDSDDVAFPSRFETQLNFLSDNPDISLVGSWAELIDENGTNVGTLRKPGKHENIVQRLSSSGFPSLGSIMFRRKLLRQNLQFDERLRRYEDFEWYLRVSCYEKMSTMPVVLMRLRQTRNSSSRTNSPEDAAALIDAVDRHFSEKLSSDNRPRCKLQGVAHYYYGSTSTARRLLFASLLKEGGKLYTLRYLLPLLILNNSTLRVARSFPMLRKMAYLYRKMELLWSLV